MRQKWRQLTYLHWPVDPSVVQATLPGGLFVDTYEGQAWIGLVPFSLHLQVPVLSRWKWGTSFAETNVRTYVKDRHGRAGVWFYSLDADRLAAVVAARTSYRLPYLWSAMSIAERDDSISYTSKRMWPGPKGARADIEVRIGAAYEPDEATDLEHFLTARWALFSSHKRGLHHAPVSHERWPLHHVELIRLDEDVVQTAGLPKPIGEPHVLFSPGVDVSVGLPHRVD